MAAFAYLFADHLAGVADPDAGTDQQNADSHGACGTEGFGAIKNETVHIALHSRQSGIVDAASGNQGQNGNDQVGDGGILSDTGHDFSKSGAVIHSLA